MSIGGFALGFGLIANLLVQVGLFFALSIWNMGFDAVRWLWRYFLLGAVIVLPIWLLARLAKAPRGL